MKNGFRISNALQFKIIFLNLDLIEFSIILFMIIWNFTILLVRIWFATSKAIHDITGLEKKERKTTKNNSHLEISPFK